MSTVRFRYAALLAISMERPTGYLEDVMAHAKLRGDDVHLSEQAYRALVAKYAPGQVIAPPPTWAQMIASAAKEGARWARAGFRLAPAEVLEARGAACQSCPHWNPTAWFGSGGCRICGCSRAKLFLSTTSCPDVPPRWTPKGVTYSRDYDPPEKDVGRSLSTADPPLFPRRTRHPLLRRHPPDTPSPG